MWRLAGSVLLALVALTPARAQEAVDQTIEALRRQLSDVTERQAQLEARVQQLDEALRPENVERSVAGVGTTDAAALRDRRRQQLEREKGAAEEQLRGLAASRARLEASIASAEAEAVRLRASALGTGGESQQPDNVTAAPAVPVAPAASPRRKRQTTRRTKVRRLVRPRRRTL